MRRFARSSLALGLALGGATVHGAGCRSDPSEPRLALRSETVRRLDAPLDASVDAEDPVGQGTAISPPTNIAPPPPPNVAPRKSPPTNIAPRKSPPTNIAPRKSPPTNIAPRPLKPVPPPTTATHP
jgi:hypothetical protein